FRGSRRTGSTLRDLTQACAGRSADATSFAASGSLPNMLTRKAFRQEGDKGGSLTLNQRVVGSSPTRGTPTTPDLKRTYAYPPRSGGADGWPENCGRLPQTFGDHPCQSVPRRRATASTSSPARPSSPSATPSPGGAGTPGGAGAAPPRAGRSTPASCRSGRRPAAPCRQRARPAPPT